MKDLKIIRIRCWAKFFDYKTDVLKDNVTGNKTPQDLTIRIRIKIMQNFPDNVRFYFFTSMNKIRKHHTHRKMIHIRFCY